MLLALLVAIAVTIGVGLLVLAVAAALVGIAAAALGEQVERCRHCGRYAITTDGEVHPAGCPSRRRGGAEGAPPARLHLPGRLHLGHDGPR